MTRYPHTILATCCVPWQADGTLDEAVFRASIQTLLGHDLRHLYLFGTAGEGYAVTDRQFDTIVEVFLDELADPRCAPMVGVISLSMSTVIERIERCADRGVTQFQISLPSWGALDDGELDRFFVEVCGRFPTLEFLHYNLPRSRRLLTPIEYGQLADRYPNLVATKNAGADGPTIVALLERAPQLRHFFTEPGYATAGLAGDAGLLLSVSSINPELAHAYFDAGVRRDAATLQTLAGEVAGITAMLLDALGTTRIDGAYDKCFNKILDDRFPLRLLPPYEGASGAQFAAFTAAVAQRYPRWLPR